MGLSRVGTSIENGNLEIGDSCTSDPEIPKSRIGPGLL